MMKAFVDQDLCIGCGVCESECPEIFEMTDDGVAVAKDQEIAEAILDQAKEAQNQCPVEAISIK